MSSLSDYHRQEVVGEGTYGVVYRAMHRSTGRIVALKQIRLLDDADEGVPCTALREIAVLKQVSSHPNIVDLISIIHSDNQLYLVFEFLNQDLRKHIERTPNGLSAALVKSYLYQIVRGLNFCHARRVYHRDLKPQNILVDREGNVKLGDFGLARGHDVPLSIYTHEVVTLWYRPPELLLGARYYHGALDVWSVGCIFAEMVTGNPLFAGDSQINMLHLIFQILGSPNEDSWPGITSLEYFSYSFPQFIGKGLEFVCPQLEPAGIDLMKKMLTLDPAQRISCKAALDHPYFDDVRH
eukprot:TRINITY_DN2565_c0_g2_i1.p1 TRINITY_DN2565_c0_g2~~TRINITY_DN2565_c0_g2_i1.p1  ORF type:complete len:296 (+),score=74.31 TRINITY_DN2565_c0_g2_i1:219-1106(+)